MAFAQNMQAYLIDRYYHHLHAAFPEQAEDTLLTAFHLYMFQQGSRGAQRAVRNGDPLDFANYERYREVVSTEEMLREDAPHLSTHTVTDGCFEARITTCTAHRLFGQLGTPPEAERLFCQNVDTMNVKGFNPHIPYRVDSILCDSEVCIQRCPQAGCKADTNFSERAPDAPPFPYIMANQFVSMGKVIRAIFGEGGQAINEQVIAEFIGRYGKEDFSKIAVYFDSDFEIPYPLGVKRR